MKIIQVTASYKPAYVYGGPTMSVSKLSEELVKVGTDLEVICTTQMVKKSYQLHLATKRWLMV